MTVLESGKGGDTSVHPLLDRAQSLRSHFEAYFSRAPHSDDFSFPSYIEGKPDAELAWQLLACTYSATHSLNDTDRFYRQLIETAQEEYTGPILTIPLDALFLPDTISMTSAFEAFQQLFEHTKAVPDIHTPHPSQLFWHTRPELKIVATHTHESSMGHPDEHIRIPASLPGHRMIINAEVDLQHPEIAKMEIRIVQHAIASLETKSHGETTTIPCYFTRPERIVSAIDASTTLWKKYADPSQIGKQCLRSDEGRILTITREEFVVKNL